MESEPETVEKSDHMEIEQETVEERDHRESDLETAEETVKEQFKTTMGKVLSKITV